MPGSKEPESPTDQQCKHCGLWFANRGIKSHEDNCTLAEYDVTLVPLAGETDEGGVPSDREGGHPTETADVVGANPTPHGPSEESEAQTVTDGGKAVAPPTPTLGEGDDENEDDHLRPIDEWFAAFEQANPETAETDEYREWKADKVETHDHVNLTDSTAEEVVFE